MISIFLLWTSIRVPMEQRSLNRVAGHESTINLGSKSVPGKNQKLELIATKLSPAEIQCRKYAGFQVFEARLHSPLYVL